MDVHDDGVGERRDIIGRLSGHFETPRAENAPWKTSSDFLVKRKKKGDMGEKDWRYEGYLYIGGISHVLSLENVKSILRISMEYRRKKIPCATCKFWAAEEDPTEHRTYKRPTLTQHLVPSISKKHKTNFHGHQLKPIYYCTKLIS